jgi:Tfp pilus assembly protein PilF
MSLIYEALKKVERDEKKSQGSENRQAFRFVAKASRSRRMIGIGGLLLFGAAVGYIVVGEIGSVRRLPERPVGDSSAVVAPSEANVAPPIPNVPLLPEAKPSDPKPQSGSTVGNDIGRAVQSVTRGDTSEAERVLTEALKLAPDSAAVYHTLGYVYKVMGQPPKAEEAYRKAIELDPDHIEAMNNLGLLYEQQNRVMEAMRLFDAALKIRPRYAEAHLNYAVLLERLGHHSEAKEHYQAFLKNSPEGRSETAGLVRKHLETLP